MSFENDGEEEIDTADIEEEDRIEYMKRRNDAIEKTPNSARNTGPTERLEDRGNDGKMTSTNSSHLLKMRQNT